MIAAETIVDKIKQNKNLSNYEEKFKKAGSMKNFMQLVM